MVSSSSIDYFYEDVSFELGSQKNATDWITRIVQLEHAEILHINYIFCSDLYLLKINKSHLGHDYFTDIISFDQSDSAALEADIFISVERVKENTTHRIYPQSLDTLLGTDYSGSTAWKNPICFTMYLDISLSSPMKFFHSLFMNLEFSVRQISKMKSGSCNFNGYIGLPSSLV